MWGRELREVSCQKGDHFEWSREVSCRGEKFHVTEDCMLIGVERFNVEEKGFMSKIKFYVDEMIMSEVRRILWSSEAVSL